MVDEAATIPRLASRQGLRLPHARKRPLPPVSRKRPLPRVSRTCLPGRAAPSAWTRGATAVDHPCCAAATRAACSRGDLPVYDRVSCHRA